MRLLGVREFVYDHNLNLLFWQTQVGQQGHTPVYKIAVVNLVSGANAVNPPSTWQPSCIQPST